jgi:hypothetical protein
MKARVVVLTSDVHLEFVKGLVEEDCLIITDESALSLLDPAKIEYSSLCLVDGRVSANSARLLQAVGVTRIIATKGVCRPLPGWPHDSWTAEHCRLGGVTTEKVTGACLSYGPHAPVGVFMQPEVGRGASTVLSIKAPARKYRSAPGNSVVHPLGCEDVGTAHQPCYHGVGVCSLRNATAAPLS